MLRLAGGSIHGKPSISDDILISVNHTEKCISNVSLVCECIGVVYIYAFLNK